MSDRNDLYQFVDDVHVILKQVVDWRELLFREELRQPIVDAWDELQSAFDDVKQRVESENLTSDEHLQQVGLMGKQLELKLKGFSGAWDKFKSWGSVKILKTVLDWIDIILGSLASLIPGADAIEEFKDSAKKGIEESEQA